MVSTASPAEADPGRPQHLDLFAGANSLEEPRELGLGLADADRDHPSSLVGMQARSNRRRPAVSAQPGGFGFDFGLALPKLTSAMRTYTFLASLALASTACAPSSLYVLGPDAPAGEARDYRGTVLSVEADGDFLLEVEGRLLFVDLGEQKTRVEMGDRVRVHGQIDNDRAEGEAPELDAARIEVWK